MVTCAALKARFAPHFLEAPAFHGFENVSLISQDRQSVTISACVFASVNPWCYKLLKSVPDEFEEYHLVTELPVADLVAFKILATTGKGSDFKTEERKAVIDCFALKSGSFGLSTLRVKATVHNVVSKKEIPDWNRAVSLETNYPMKEEIDYTTQGGFNANIYPNIAGPLNVKEESQLEGYLESDLNSQYYGQSDLNNVNETDYFEIEGEIKQDYESDDQPLSRKRKSSKKGPKSQNKAKRAKTANSDAETDNPSDEDYVPAKEWPKPNDPENPKKKDLPYQCGQCPKGFSVKGNYMQHVRRHSARSKDDRFFCLRCTEYVAFKTRQELSDHLVNQHKKDWNSRINTKTKVNADINDKYGEIRDDAKWWKCGRAFDFTTDESKRQNLDYPCHLCTREFKSKSSLMQHVRRHSALSKDDRWFCLECTDYVAFRTQKELFDHVRENHAKGNSREQFQCEHCPHIIFSALYRLQFHMEKFHSGSQLSYNCLSCGRSFKSIEDLRGHKKSAGKHHDGKCRLCPDFEAKTWEENLKHFDDVHQGQRQYKCGSCSEYFLSENQYLSHRRKYCTTKVKNPTPKEICPFCAKNITKSYMDMHVKMYHGSHSIPCEYKGCKMVLKHPDLMAHHIKKHHTEHTCDTCGKTFNRLLLYQNHCKRSHLANDLKTLICKICGKGFATKQPYDDHMNVHTGAKPHKCPHCGTGFASMGTMRGHVRNVHLGIKRK